METEELKEKLAAALKEIESLKSEIQRIPRKEIRRIVLYDGSDIGDHLTVCDWLQIESTVAV